MENKDFDKFIKEGLEHNSLSNSYSSDWDRMEELLGMDEAGGDEAFDQYLKKGIALNSKTAHSSDWDMMEELLDKDERERKELVYIKGIELVLVLLAIITLFQFYPDSTIQSKNPFQSTNESTTAIQENNLNETVGNHLALNNNSTNSKIEESTNTDVSDKNNIAVHPIKDANQVINNTRSADPSINAYEVKNHIVNNVSNDKIIDNVSNFTTQAPSTSVVDKTNISSISTNPIIDEATTLKGDKNIIEKGDDTGGDVEDKIIRSDELEPIEALDNNPLVEPKANTEKISVTIPKLQFRTSYHVGINRNHIFTPYNTESKSSFQQANYGFSTGMKVSLQKGKWEFETGLSYIRKAYRPQPVYEVRGNTLEGYEAETLQKLSFNTISVPLDIRFYTLDMTNKWNLYIVTGANFNTVAWSNYGRYTYDISVGNNSSNITAGRPLKSVDNQKAGIFYGESLKDNFYMTASLGVGMEVSIGERANFFTQPKFTYYLLPGTVGLGPNNDQFNTISVDVGLRFKM